MAKDPERIIAKRTNALAFLTEMPGKLETRTKQWQSLLPEGSPARGLNFGLIQFLRKHLNYGDTLIVNHLTNGMPLAGVVPPTAVLRRRATPAVISREKWLSNLKERNVAMVDRAKYYYEKDTELSKRCWLKTLEEASKGRISQPVPATSDVLDNAPLSPMFAIEEEHGGWETKLRVIDDFKASQVNDLLELSETCVPDSLDVALAMLAMQAKLQPGAPIRIFSVDFAHAYKQACRGGLRPGGVRHNRPV